MAVSGFDEGHVSRKHLQHWSCRSFFTNSNKYRSSRCDEVALHEHAASIHKSLWSHFSTFVSGLPEENLPFLQVWTMQPFIPWTSLDDPCSLYYHVSTLPITGLLSRNLD